jgi:BMFP domain-containing protein YqiC
MIYLGCNANETQTGNKTMTKIQKQLKTLAANKNRKIAQAMLGKIRKEIQSWSVSIDAKRSAYRQVLRVSGHTDQQHIEILADAYIR